jgi:uncharacterized protein
MRSQGVTMHKTILSLLLLATTLVGHAAPASEQSIENLLAITKTESMMDSMYNTFEQSMRQGMQAGLGGGKLTAEQQRAVDLAPKEFVKVMREEMAWAKLKPVYIQIYQETLTQEEIDGLSAFYASPAGQAFINKMPVVMQKSQMAMQVFMQPMVVKMKAAMDKAMADAKAGR